MIPPVQQPQVDGDATWYDAAIPHSVRRQDVPGFADAPVQFLSRRGAPVAPPANEFAPAPRWWASASFWRGTAVGVALALSFVAGRAWGETIAIGGVWINGSAQPGTTVSIEPSDDPGQLAVVTLVNRHVNDAADDGTYYIGIPGLAVGVEFTWDGGGLTGADSVTVLPPEGITCVPADCTMTVMEGFDGRVVLLDWVGM